MTHSNCMQLKIDPEFPEPRIISHAVAVLERGGVLAYPTDTNYGIGCAIYETEAIDRVLKLKNLDKCHLLSIICPDLSDIARYAILENNAYQIMKRHLPGPYTFILRATPEVPKMFRSERQTIGIRVPDNPAVLMMTRIFRKPIVSTSTVLNNRVCRSGTEVNRDFGYGLDLILDSGTIETKDSTVIDLSGPYPVVERQGAGDISRIVV
ncbi:MAG: threonylcarbamoyl-AMP synthase [Myxococcales bacterium]|nr:threonylcarbamoyl-AMP synthase [Myxococcales bacterium]USN51286.1 MAG: threonylcarbamoyl-AMP synthase [Myxococcales bacterium]